MRLFAKIGVSLALLVLGLTPAWAQDPARQPADQRSASLPPLEPAVLGAPEPAYLGQPEPVTPKIQIPADVTLGKPEPAVLRQTAFAAPIGNPMSGALPSSVSTDIVPFAEELGLRPGTRLVFRGQLPPEPAANPFGTPPPPPPIPGSMPGTGPSPNPLDCGVPENGNFWERFCERMKNCGKEIFGSVGTMFQPGSDHKPFQSDHEFDMFSSPVSMPFFFLDPRSLTEVKPIFIFQQTRRANPMFAGGSNEFLGLQGSLALTERISIRITELGLSFMEPNNPSNNPAFGPNVGPSEFHIGPQVTIIRNKETKTLLAAGLTFEVPWGSQKEFQHTGTLGVVPYVSFAQNFLGSKYGSVNFMNTTGWAGGSQRTDFFFSNFHFDYNIRNVDRFFPMIELNWIHYTNSGNQIPLGFEGADLYNFGSYGVAGTNEVILNFGGRVKINNFWSVGAAAGFSLIGGGSHLDAFRLTVDMIFRY